MKKFVLVFGLCSAGLFAAAFTNGGFESGTLPSGYDFSNVPTAWAKGASSGGLFYETYTQGPLPALNGEGSRAFGFGGNGATTGSLAQTFDTIAAGTYLVSFQYVSQQNPNPGFQRLLAEALNGSTVLNSSTQRFNNLAWITTTFSFVAATTSTTLRFSDNPDLVNDGSGFSENWALDAVTVTRTDTQPSSGVPEPSTFALAAGALAFLADRRR